MNTAYDEPQVNPTNIVHNSGQHVFSGGMTATACIAAFSFVLHMVFNNRYGYFRDEFDYIICGRHLAWGYVDQPPLLPVLSRIFLAIFGESLRSVRLLPALTSAALICSPA